MNGSMNNSRNMSIFLPALALSLIGVVLIYSATYYSLDPLDHGLYFKQLIWLMTGIALVLLLAAIIVAPTKRTYSITNRMKQTQYQPIYYKEGLNNTIEITKHSDAALDLFIDGELNATTSKSGMLVHRLLTQLPLLLHPNPKSIFLVGLGSGMTAGAVLPFENVSTIKCAEISGDIVRAVGVLVGGQAVTTYEDEEGEAVDVRVRLPAEMRRDVSQIGDLRLAVPRRTGAPALIPLSELVRDGETGTLVPYGDPRAMAEAAVQLLRDAPRRQEYAARAREWARRFTWDEAALQTEDVLRRALAERAPAVRGAS